MKKIKLNADKITSADGIIKSVELDKVAAFEQLEAELNDKMNQELMESRQAIEAACIRGYNEGYQVFLKAVRAMESRFEQVERELEKNIRDGLNLILDELPNSETLLRPLKAVLANIKDGAEVLIVINPKNRTQLEEVLERCIPERTGIKLLRIEMNAHTRESQCLIYVGNDVYEICYSSLSDEIFATLRETRHQKDKHERNA
ncbi:hypothetical protein [Brucella anthropi]|uniref:hypothetical protein n=1 Tax=Brucella anthropi TaxID=529 RepID=UPI00384F9B53